MAGETALHADNHGHMEQIVTPAAAESGPDFRRIKERFFAINKKRLARTRADMGIREQEFLELLPFCFHSNHPLLPGYVAKDAPAGIPDYTPSSLALQLSKRMARSFTYKKRAYRQYDIHAIYLMGSTGTIAYSDKSDLDIWVCYDSQLSRDQVEVLANKARAVERWAQAMEVDANIFLVDPEQFKQGLHGPLSKESSGSALHYLLLEEFYRTSVLIAGRYPVWWLVPPDQERDYDAYVEDIRTKRYIHSREHIDLGGLQHIHAEEFYGATLWLLYKGINSPYKSVLKTLLMEAYASEYPGIDLLGTTYKRAIYNGEEDADLLDPYVMMLNKVETYLQAQQQPDRLQLVRESFYFKVNEPLSQEKAGPPHWRRQRLAKLVQGWQWTPAQLYTLDTHNDWKIRKVSEERRKLITELTRSYRFLSDFARNYAGSMNLIRQSDLNVLGRKLYAAFERKAGKIEILYKGITENLLETHLSFHRRQGEDGRHYWLAFSGLVTEEEAAAASPLKRTYNVMELLSWCYFNKLVDRTTVIALYTQGGDLHEKELRYIVEHMEKLLPHRIFNDVDIYDLRQPPRIASMATFINVGFDPFSRHSKRGDHLTSDRTDALKYGGRLENLALVIDFVIITTWQEVLTLHYSGVDGLIRCLSAYFQWTPPSSGRRPPKINAFSFSCYRGVSIARRIEQLFEDVVRCFYDSEHPEAMCYVLGVEWDYLLLRMDKDILHYERAPSMEGLLSHLSQPRAQFVKTVFDVEALSKDVLPLIYEQNRAGEVQFFYFVKDELVYIYVLDEKGALFYQQREFHDVATLLGNFQKFFDVIHNRLQFITGENGPGGGSSAVSYHRIEKLRGGDWRIEQHGLGRQHGLVNSIYLQVIVSRLHDDNVYNLYCGEREFSSIEHGEQLFYAVAEHIMSLRASGEDYPIHVTDIDLSEEILSSSPLPLQTVHYLKYKMLIEDKLLQALSQRGQRPQSD
ncbi:MAG: class I adenylate cyclase [Gammaproteobacteria bacterium]